MSQYVEDRYYYQVSSSVYENSEYTVPNGGKLTIYEVGGNAARSSDVHIQICWNPGGGDQLCLFATHGDDKQHVNIGPFTGDGTKVVRIMLNNDSSQTETIGGWWKGVLE